MRFMASRMMCLITVSVGLVRTVDWDTNVVGLFLGKEGELGSKSVKVQAGDLLVKDLGKDVDLSTGVLGGVLLVPELQLSKDLVCERARHDERWVTSGTSQVKKTSLGEDNNTASLNEFEAVDLGLDVDALGGLHETVHVNFVIEVTNVSDDSVVLHLVHVFGHEDTLVTSGGDEDIAEVEKVAQRQDGETFHAGLKGTDGVNLGNVDDATVGTHGSGATLTDITVSADDGLLSGKHDVSGTHDSIGKRVLASVKVVELGLGHRVVDIDGSEKKVSGLLHGVETVDSSGGLLGNSVASGGNLVPLVGHSGIKETLDDSEDNLEFSIVGGGRVGLGSVLEEKILGLLTLVDDEGHVTTIIDNKIGTVALAIIVLPGEGVQGALPVFLKGFSLPCENSGRFVTGNSGGGVVLSGEDVARAPSEIGSKGLKSLDKDGSLDGHVEGSRDTGCSKGLLGSVFLAARHESRHLNLSELNILATIVGEGNVSN
jgi:hypothetical protein